MATDMNMSGFYLDKNNEDRLLQYSKDNNLSKSEIVRRSLSLYLDMHLQHQDTMKAAYKLSKYKKVPYSQVIAHALAKVLPKKFYES